MTDHEPVQESEPFPPGSVIVVAGAGLMGSQIGLEYALAGYEMRLLNRTVEASERAVVRAAAAADVLVTYGLVSRGDAAQGLARLTGASDLESACSGAALVVESIAENMQAKVELFQRIAGAAPGAVLATNTSSLPVSELGSASGESWRLVGTHYWNPPTLMPLVEVTPAEGVHTELLERVIATLTAVGKQPVIAPDIPGFIWNRLQIALLREAIALVSRHGVEPETVDVVIRKGLGRRYGLVGPFETVALGGVGTFGPVLDFLSPQLAEGVTSQELASIPLLQPGPLESIRAARDQGLASLLRADRSPQEDIGS